MRILLFAVCDIVLLSRFISRWAGCYNNITPDQSFMLLTGSEETQITNHTASILKIKGGEKKNLTK
jgi:hypothetical protein